MKAIICEMCNGQELVKQDGYFVCQSCGTRYSVEEAKKMMVEVEGAVKIDNSDFVERYLQNARRAKAKEDWLEVEKYYNMVEQNDPTNIEAIFYSAFGKAKWSLNDNDIYKRQAIFKSLTKSISIIDDNYDVEKERELKPILGMITKDIMDMVGGSFVYTETRNGYGNVTSNNSHMTYSLFADLVIEMVYTLSNVFQKFSESSRANVIYILMYRQKLAEILGRNFHFKSSFRKSWLEKCVSYAMEIKKYNPSYVIQDYKREGKTPAGCWVFFIFAIIFCVVAVTIVLNQ